MGLAWTLFIVVTACVVIGLHQIVFVEKDKNGEDDVDE